MNSRPDCLIVSANAEELAKEIARLADFPLSLTSCASAEQALSEYTNESVVFGNPDLIAEILPELPSVDWVQSSWAGVTPLIALDRRDYILTGIKGVFGPQISEYVLAYMLANELKVVQRWKEQCEHSWDVTKSGTLQGKRLGIMGTGTIGQHIANAATGFGVSILGLSRLGEPAPGFSEVLPIGQLHHFLKNLDYLVAILPQTAATDSLLDATALAKLPPHAYLINVGRSNIIDDGALIDALTNDRLAGAVLDVFDEEPISESSRLWDTPNLSITAHIAAVSYPSLIVPIFIENYRRYVDKRVLKYVIDFDVGY